MAGETPASLGTDSAERTQLDATKLRVIECDAEPRHPELFYVHDDDIWYPPVCYLCILHDDSVRRDQERHARHRTWHRWRIVRWLMTQAYCSGLALTGGGHAWGGYGGCNGCVTSWPKFGRGERYYVLWWQRRKWACLRRGHWPGEYVGMGACGKCLPCPDCGSTTAGHNEGCAW